MLLEVDLENKTVGDAEMILQVVNNGKSMSEINILKKKLDFETRSITSCYRKCILPLQYLSDCCLHGIYVLQKLRRKNISGLEII